MLFYPFTSRVTYDEQGLPLYDRAVDSAFLRDFYKAYWSDGVFYDPTTSFQVTAAGAGMALQVAPGKAQIQGAFAIETAVQGLSVTAADTTNNRVDAVVLRLDLSLDKRNIELAVLKGTPAADPVAPALTRNSTVWELGLANIAVRKNVSTLTQQDITDTRLDPQRCGVVAQTIGELDTSAYFLQLQAALEQIQKELSDLNAGSATMLKDEYDLDRAVLTAGGIKAYTDERLQPVQTNLSNLAADVGKLQTGVDNLQYSNAGAHNAVYRGKALGSSVSDEQYAAIGAGTFDDLYIGDYWTIGGVNYRIAAFDYFLNSGDTECTAHHVVLVPDTCLYKADVNSTNTTTGGYVGSAMHKTNLEQAKTIIKSAFSGHVLNKRVYLVNAVANGAPSAGAWADSEVDLMTERMVYGCPVFSPMTDGQKDQWSSMHNYTVEKSQLPLFQHEPSRICNRDNWWLRDIVSASGFALVGEYGRASYYYASTSLGVRPFFCIR